MSSDRELTRIVRSWMEEGVNVLPDRVLDEVLAQLPVTSQRRPWWRAWRTNFMNGTLKFAAGGAAVLVVAAIALAVYFSRPAIVPAASPSPLQTASISTATSTPTDVAQPTDTSAPPPIGTQPPVGDKAAWVLFLSRPEGVGRPPLDLWAMRADGTEARIIYRQFGLPSIAWSQDGDRLLGVIENADGKAHVYLAEVADDIGPFVDTGFTTGAETACHGKSREDLPCQSAAFSFAPDGERVVFVQRCTSELPGCMFLTILDLRSGELTELDATLDDARHPLALPTWSPDGSRIAFTRETDNRVIGEGGIPTSNLYVIDSDGRNLRQIELGGLSATAPRWSPDLSTGATIAFSTIDWVTDGNLDQDVYIVGADESTQPRRLTRDGMSTWPEWTGPDEIRFRRGDPQSTVSTFWVMTSHGGDATELVDLGALAGQLDPPLIPSNIGVPGDPGTTFWWQPAD